MRYLTIFKKDYTLTIPLNVVLVKEKSNFRKIKNRLEIICFLGFINIRFF